MTVQINFYFHGKQKCLILEQPPQKKLSYWKIAKQNISFLRKRKRLRAHSSSYFEMSSQLLAKRIFSKESVFGNRAFMIPIF